MSIKYLSAQFYSIFIGTYLQDPRAAMAYSSPPLTLFKTHRNKNLL